MMHGAVRELREEAGLEATRIVRKVGTFLFTTPERNGEVRWVKHIFEMEVKNLNSIVLDPVEHGDYRWATEEEIIAERVGDVVLKYISADNKSIKLEAFRHRREAATRWG
jgi:8-oxo-dGTP pyrophosphatase MutT (NUDIX family)